MPLGPAGFVVGAIVGGAIGVAIGLFADWIRLRNRCREAIYEENKIDNLLRWADFVFYQCQEPVPVLLYVVINFHVIRHHLSDSAISGYHYLGQ